VLRDDEINASLTRQAGEGHAHGPVTILAWSLVRDDQPLADTANQIALASATRP